MVSMIHEFTDILTHESAQVDVQPPSLRPPVPLELLGACGAMHALRKQLVAFAPYDVPLLIVGEPGTETQRVAEYVHRRSERRDGPFTVVEAAALTEERWGLELFGCESDGCPCWLPGVREVGPGGTLLLKQVECLPTWALHRLVWGLDRSRTGGNSQAPCRRRSGSWPP